MQEKTPLEIKEMMASNPILKVVDVGNNGNTTNVT